MLEHCSQIRADAFSQFCVELSAATPAGGMPDFDVVASLS
jgi:hypothetical protein